MSSFEYFMIVVSNVLFCTRLNCSNPGKLVYRYLKCVHNLMGLFIGDILYSFMIVVMMRYYAFRQLALVFVFLSIRCS